MGNKRPNTLLVLIILLWQGACLLYEGTIAGISSLLSGKMRPLKSRGIVRIGHWIAVSGPRRFWKFPRSIQIGRSLATLIQVVFYPKK